MQRWGSYFIKVTRYLLLLPATTTVTYYLENKVTVTVLHIILLFENTSAIP